MEVNSIGLGHSYSDQEPNLIYIALRPQRPRDQGEYYCERDCVCEMAILMLAHPFHSLLMLGHEHTPERSQTSCNSGKGQLELRETTVFIIASHRSSLE